MKFYIAAKFQLKEKVREIYTRLQEEGHEITADWTLHKSIKPYEDNPDIAQEYAIEDINAAQSCDVFVILSEEAGTGMYVELGAAISSNLKQGKPKIYIIGNHNTRSMFYFHPSVNRRNNLEEVLQEIKLQNL